MADDANAILITWDFGRRAPRPFYRHLAQLAGDGFVSNPANRVLANVYLVYDPALAREIAALVEVYGGEARRFGVRDLDTGAADGRKMDAAREKVGRMVVAWSKRGPRSPRPDRS